MNGFGFADLVVGLLRDYGVMLGVGFVIGLTVGVALGWWLKPPRYITPNRGVWDVNGWHPNAGGE